MDNFYYRERNVPGIQNRKVDLCSVLSKLLEPRLIFVFGEFLSEPSKSFRITSQPCRRCFLISLPLKIRKQLQPFNRTIQGFYKDYRLSKLHKNKCTSSKNNNTHVLANDYQIRLFLLLHLDGALNNDSATFWQLFLGISGSTIKFKGKIALTNF